MIRIDAILEDAEALSAGERSHLLDRLRRIAGSADGEGDGIAVGERGLAALKESTVDEDWSAYYPAGLNDGFDCVTACER